MDIRLERPGDAVTIAAVTDAAFKLMHYSSGTESRIIVALRDDAALALSLVAEDEGVVVGHIAFSPVRIEGREGPWYGLGPVSVRPDLQRRGIGSALIRDGLRRLVELGGETCVLLGDPRYYGRFGFIHDPALTYSFPTPAFQRLVLSGEAPTGEVTYHRSFEAG